MPEPSVLDPHHDAQLDAQLETQLETQKLVSRVNKARRELDRTVASGRQRIVESRALLRLVDKQLRELNSRST